MAGPYPRIAFAALLALTFVACNTFDAKVDRRETYLEAHPDTRPEVREAILEGTVIAGMSYAEVVASIDRFDNAGPDVSDLGDYFVRLYDTRALTFHGEELETSELIFVSTWTEDPLFQRLRARIRNHDAGR